MKHKHPLPRLALFIDALVSLGLGLTILGGLFIAGITVYTVFADEIPQKPRFQIEVDGPASTTIHTRDGERVEMNYHQTFATLPIREDQRAGRLTSLVGSLLGLGIGGAILFQFRRFINSLRTSHPFVMANARRLQSIAWLLLAGYGAKALFNLLLILQTQHYYPDLGLNVTLREDLGFLVFPLTIFLIAEVFRVGVSMKTEQDLTV